MDINERIRGQGRNRPCRVCGNKRQSQLSRHHLLPRNVRHPGTPQVTVKLCKHDKGCQTHMRFHMGDKGAAMRIRKILESWEIQWMVEQVGSKWVRTIYPSK